MRTLDGVERTPCPSCGAASFTLTLMHRCPWCYFIQPAQEDTSHGQQ